MQELGVITPAVEHYKLSGLMSNDFDSCLWIIQIFFYKTIFLHPYVTLVYNNINLTWMDLHMDRMLGY